MQLFALVNGSPNIHRISLSQTLGPAVGAVFIHQAKSFLHEVTPLEFDAGHIAEDDEILFIDAFAPAT